MLPYFRCSGSIIRSWTVGCSSLGSSTNAGVGEALGHEQALPESKMGSMEEFLEKSPDVKVLILDGTERSRQRPKNPEEQKKNYLGKKNVIHGNTLQELLETKK